MRSPLLSNEWTSFHSSLALDVLPIIDSRTSALRTWIFNACVLSLLPSATHLFRSPPFFLCHRLLNEHRLIDGDGFCTGRSIFISCIVCFFLKDRQVICPFSSAVVHAFFLPLTWNRRSKAAKSGRFFSSFEFLIDRICISLFLLSIYVVEAPLHQVVINSVSRSQPSSLPARFHTRLAFCTVAFPSLLL